MTYRINTLETLSVIAEARGCILIKAAPNELLIDDDKNHGLPRELIKLVVEKFGPERRREVWRSRNGGSHVLLELSADLHPFARIALQASLGSDPTREILAIWEYFLQETDTISLFKPKVR